MKTNNLLFTALYTLFALCLISCDTSDISYYSDNEAAVRFPGGDNFPEKMNGYNTVDQLFYAVYSFLDAGTSGKESVVYDIPIILIGNPVNSARSVNYVIDQENTIAPTESYEIIEAVIPANEAIGYVRVKLRNATELENTTYTLALSLKGSKDLSAGPEKYIRTKLSWNNQIPAPSVANYIRTYNMLIAGEASYISTSLNSYSNRALRVIVDALNWTNWDDPNVHNGMFNTDKYKYLPRYSFILNDNSYQAYSAKVGAYIKKHNAEHPDNPLLHDGGKNAGKAIESRYTNN